jgi:hypothetical protein
MGAPRRLAAALLRAVLRMAPPASREWASAVLRELDFIPGEWAALFWALGSAAAIFRHAGGAWRLWFAQLKSNGEERMNSKGRKAIGIVSGAVSAVMLVACAFGLLHLTSILFPGLGIVNTGWTHLLTMVVIPEAVFIAAAFVLWRSRRPIAAGILLIAVAIGLHVAIWAAIH